MGGWVGAGGTAGSFFFVCLGNINLIITQRPLLWVNIAVFFFFFFNPAVAFLPCEGAIGLIWDTLLFLSGLVVAPAACGRGRQNSCEIRIFR